MYVYRGRAWFPDRSEDGTGVPGCFSHFQALPATKTSTMNTMASVPTQQMSTIKNHWFKEYMLF